jgi:surface protein
MAEIVNITSLDPNNFEFQDYSINDSSLITSFETETSFDSQKDIIEYFIYDINNNILYENTFGFPRYKLIDNLVSIDPEGDLKSLGYDEGQYNTLYNFVSPKLASNANSRYFISQISPDRTEIRLDTTSIPNELVVSSSLELVNNINNSTGSYYDFYLDFGNNQLVIANNAQLDNSDLNNPTVLIKLYEALPLEFTLKSELWVVTKVASSVAYNINITQTFNIEDEFIYLKGPNTNINVQNQINNSTNYSNLSQLSTTDSIQGSGSLRYQLNNLLAKRGIDINIDYSDYSNFIHFSSAQTRLENFYYKLSLIEQYNYSASLSNNTPTNYYVSSSNILYQTKIDEIITGFDNYEYYLYYDSSSAAWPKTNSTPPYVNVLTSSPTGMAWFATQSIIAEDYDVENNNALTNAIPGYILDDSANAQYDLFVEMVGQYFDTVFLYTQDITNKYNADNRVNYGVSKDLVADILRDLGIKIYQNNFSTNDLYSALLGLTPSGSLYNLPFTTGSLPTPTGFEYINTYITASNTSSLIPTEDLNAEIYKRIYANLPYLLKKKGSVEGLRALLTIYGIPDTILRVNEFGGKDKNPNTWDYWQNEYNYTFSTSGSGFVSAPWDGSEFISLWRTSNTSVGSSTSTQIALPLVNTGTYNMLVDWGDGTQDTITIWNQAQRTHTYANAGDYTITIKGVCRGFQFNDTGDKLKLLNILQYGILNLSTGRVFWGCTNFNPTATDAPIISTTNMEYTFISCTNFNGNINNWDVSNVTGLRQTFQGCTNFNKPLNNWNVSKVTIMGGLFAGCTNFNQDLSSWDVSSVVLFGAGGGAATTGMFNGATNFNNGGNSGINNWQIKSNVNNVSFAAMFEGCTKFNQPIGNWNTSGVDNMSGMFTGATIFNQDIGNWNTSNVTNMNNMFFQATLFNQDISSWNTSNVTTMDSMFLLANAFNQNISSWDVSKVTSLRRIFSVAATFNQNLSSWNLRLAGVNLDRIFELTNMSCQNYTDTIVSWANKAQLNGGPLNTNMATQSGRIFDGTRSGGAGFASATAARAYLTTATPTGAGWTISGDTLGAC